MSAAQDHAHLMAEHGLRVVPIGVGQKHPPIQEWQHEATSNVETHEAWWGPHPEWGLGWKMGAQDDGRWLFAIDVDVNKGGRESFRALVDEYELSDEFKATTTARTGGGGFHFVFELPDDPKIVPTNRSRLRAGIDVRAEGGQIVVAPTLHPTTGRAYAWEPGKAPWLLDPQVASAELMSMIADLQTPIVLALVSESAAIEHQPTGVLSPADFVHHRWDFSTFLNKHGWDHLGGERWRRPDKWDRGASAMLKGDGTGPLNVFTTEIPEALERLGRLDRSGQCISVTLFNFIAAYEHGGDTTALSQRVMADPAYIAHLAAGTPRGQPAHAGETDEPPTADQGTTPRHRLPVIAAEYWDDERNAHILQAARARRVGPDALDINVLCLQSLLIPPGYVLPPLIGGTAPINMLGCILARTGETKTTATRVAKDLLGPMPPWVLMLSVGSGEGIGATFLMEERKEDAKGVKQKTGRLVRNPDVWAGFFETDEGLNLIQQMRRQGATIISTLCKAWSGSQLGEANADPSKRRIVAEMSYRLASVINIQPTNFEHLFSVANTGTGLTGRFLFAPASDYDVPDERPPWPGLLEFPRLANMDIEIGVPDEIVAEIDAAIVAVHRNASLDGGGDATSHRNQVALRIAAVRAVARGERAITPDDWRLAKMRTDVSAKCQAALETWNSSSTSDRRHQEDEAKAASAIRQREITERADIAKFKGRIIERCGRGEMTRRQIKDLKDAPRDVLWTALDEALAEGLLICEDSRYRRAR